MKSPITSASIVLWCVLAGSAHAEPAPSTSDGLPTELESSSISKLEEIIQMDDGLEMKVGYATYYAKRFEGRKTTSGHLYRPEKMTAAHQNLPIGTLVRVVNPATSQEVLVTINDRCAGTAYPFIDLSRAAAKKIGLWGKGRIRVVIIPLQTGPLEHFSNE